MVSVEQWAEIRRLHFVRGLSIKEIARRTGHGRNTIRRVLRAQAPPRYQRPPRPSKLDPFREEIQRLLREEPRLPGTRVRELLGELGYSGSKTNQRTSYRPGALLQCDIWQPSREIPVGHGQLRRGYVVVCCLPYSRAGAGTLVFSKEAPDLLCGIARCLTLLGGLPETLVWDREGALHAGGGRPTDPFAAFLGELRLSWRFLAPHDPESKGVVERLQGYLETSFEPGRRFANEHDYQEQLERWFQERANVRFHRTLRCRPADRLAEELAVMRPLPEALPDTDRRFCTRVPPDPYVRVDTCDYSLDPRLAGRRVEVRVSQREVVAVCLDTAEPACRHRRSFARHRTITALGHARALRELRGAPPEPEVERRPLARYDALIPA